MDPDERIEATWNAAGLASKRARNFNEAERLYLKCLHFSFKRTKNWENIYATATNNMAILYWDWCETFTFEEGGSAAMYKSTAFMCLLLASNAACDASDIKRSLRLLCPENDDPLKFLKPRFRRKKAAKEILAKAVADPNNVKQFQSILHGCLNEQINIEVHDIDESQESLERSFQQRQKENAREYVQKETMGNYLLMCCNCCGVALEGAKRCPCRTVCYVRYMLYLSALIYFSPCGRISHTTPFST